MDLVAWQIAVTRTLGWHTGADVICAAGFTMECPAYVSSTLDMEVAAGGVGAMFERSRTHLSAEHNLRSRWHNVVTLQMK